MLAFVAQNGQTRQHADKALMKHRGLVLAAAAYDGRALKHVDEALMKDPGVVLAAVAQNGHVRVQVARCGDAEAALLGMQLPHRPHPR